MNLSDAAEQRCLGFPAFAAATLGVTITQDSEVRQASRRRGGGRWRRAVQPRDAGVSIYPGAATVAIAAAAVVGNTGTAFTQLATATTAGEA
ncbi:MAG: hypothetical protein AB7V46_00245 [Thermomicrobiales bacterium]